MVTTVSTAPRVSRALVPSLCFIVMTTAVVQTSVVPLLPAMAEQLDVGPSAVAWALTANLLAAAVCTPVLGRLADRRGARGVLLTILILVLAGSVLCLAWKSLVPLVIGRTLQGLSFALFPIGVAVLRGVLSPPRLSGAIGLMSGLLGVGGGVGMVAAGLLHTGDADYRRVFWLLLVLGAVALGLAWFVVPASSGPPQSGGLDPVGTVALAIGLSALLLALAEGGRWGWGSVPTLALAFGGVLVLCGWYLHERRIALPLVPPGLLTGRAVGPTHLAALLVGAAMYVQFLGAAQFVQADPAVAGYGFGASVLAASVVYLLPGSIAGVIAASLSGKLIGKFGAARVLIVSCVIGVAGFTLLVFAHDHAWQLICALIVVNIFVSASYAALPALLVERVSESDTGVVNAINAIARTFGSSVASAFVAAVLASITLAGTHIAAERAYLVAFCVGGVAAGMAGLVAIWASCVSNDKI